MTAKQEIILRIAKDGWIPDLSLTNFPQLPDKANPVENLEAALEAIEKLNLGCVSISAQRQDYPNLINYAMKNTRGITAGVHSLLDTPHALRLARQHELHCPRYLHYSGSRVKMRAKIITSQGGFSRKTYKIVGKESVMIAGGTTPSEWQAEWEKGANFVKFPGVELLPPNYLATYQPSLHNLIPFYVSGYFITPDMRMDKEKLKAAVSPYIKAGTFTFGLGYPFRPRKPEDNIKQGSLSVEEIVEKGRLLLQAIKEVRQETNITITNRFGEKAFTGTLYDAIAGADNYAQLVKRTGRSFNA